MQSAHFQLCQGLLDPTYIKQAEQAYNSQGKKIANLFAHRKIPREPWTDEQIVSFLHQLSQLDANNADKNVGVGEREGRIFSSLVRQRHYGMAHGKVMLPNKYVRAHGKSTACCVFGFSLTLLPASSRAMLYAGEQLRLSSV